MADIDIKLDEAESELWHEVGPRGEKFRQAQRDRAAEQVRLKRRMVEIDDSHGAMVEAVPDPEPEPPAVREATALPQGQTLEDGKSE